MTPQNLRVASPSADLQVAIYARVSSDQQAERHTIDSQMDTSKNRVFAEGSKASTAGIIGNCGDRGRRGVRVNGVRRYWVRLRRSGR